jgi:hypothetical protein
MSRFSEVTRIEAAIKNKNAKELEWSLWYCRMRQAVPVCAAYGFEVLERD